MNAFHLAIQSHDLAAVGSFLAEHCGVTSATMEFAAQHADAATLRLILDADRGDQGCVTAAGDSLIHVAIRHNADIGVLALLLARAAPLQLLHENFAGESILDEAAKSSDERAIELVMNAVDIVAQSARTDRVRSPLHVCAAQCHNATVAERIIARGVGVDVVDKFGVTPLQVAVQSGQLSVARALIGAGARLDVVGRGWHRYSLMHYAAMRNDARFVTLLLDAGVDCSLRDKDLRTPLHVATENNNADVLATLLASGKFDIDVADAVGATACHVAANQANDRLIELLIGARCRLDLKQMMPYCNEAAHWETMALLRGALPNELRQLGMTPAWHAAGNVNERVMEMLVRADADLCTGNIRGETPCLRAATNRNEGVLAALAGANAGAVRWDAEDVNGNNVWILAMGNPNERVLMTLFSCNEAISCLRASERAPLKRLPWFEAIKVDNRRALELFLCAGVNLDALQDGQTVLQHAVHRDNVELATLLIASGADVDAQGARTHSLYRSATSANMAKLLTSASAETEPLATSAISIPDDVFLQHGHMLHLQRIIIGSGRTFAAPSAEERVLALRSIAAAQLRLVRWRAFEVLVALQSLNLDALRLCDIVLFACGPIATTIPFHKLWRIATTVKHFR